MESRRIAFIGAGNMARGLIGGLRARGVAAQTLVVADPAAEQLEAVRQQFGVATTSDNAAAVKGADVVVLAVKPQYLRPAVEALEAAIANGRPLVLSVAAGIRSGAIAGWLGGYDRIVRTMPNRPALLGLGITALYAAPQVDSASRTVAEQILAAVGRTVWVDQEDQLDAVTAVSGSGPAYFFLLIELLEAAAIESGLPAGVARELSIETAYGAACMAHARDTDPAELRAQVTSRGGTTEAALKEFEAADLRGIVSRAVAAARRRAAQLAEQ